MNVSSNLIDTHITHFSPVHKKHSSGEVYIRPKNKSVWNKYMEIKLQAAEQSVGQRKKYQIPGDKQNTRYWNLCDTANAILRETLSAKNTYIRKKRALAGLA